MIVERARKRKNPVETVRSSSHSFTTIFTPAEEGGYTVTCPALPGLVTEGNTLAQARRMAADAIEGYIESLLMDERPVPRDKTRVEDVQVKVA